MKTEQAKPKLDYTEIEEIVKVKIFKCKFCGKESRDSVVVFKCQIIHKQKSCEHTWKYKLRYEEGFYSENNSCDAHWRINKECSNCKKRGDSKHYSLHNFSNVFSQELLQKIWEDGK